MRTGPANAAIQGLAADPPLHKTREKLAESVERYIKDFLLTERERWRRIQRRADEPITTLAELLAAGGKRLRPAFCVTGYLAAGGDPEDEGVVAAAAALELVHACALIHDDVMDGATTRRGQPTAHVRLAAEHRDRRWLGEPRRYGENVAILAGDLALIYADRMMSDAGQEIAADWAELRTELIIGQHLDVAAAAEGSVDTRLSRWIALSKSGHYTIHRPLAMGARLAGRPELESAFAEYGVAVGEAFQLRDDLIDAFGDAAVSGKPAALDIDRHKMTLLMSLAMERDPRIDELFRTSRDVAELRRLIVASGVREEVEGRIAHLVNRGAEALAAASLDRVWRDELTLMAHRVAYRDS